MGLTPEQIAGVMHQDNANAAQAVNLMQLPADMALKQAQLRAAERKEPTIPVETPYGVVNMTIEQAMVVADKTANRGLREEALNLQRQNAADSAENRALMAGIAGQNAQTARDRLAEAKTENIREADRAAMERQDKERNNIMKHMETYTKNPKGSPTLLAASINDAAPEVSPDIMFVNSYGDSYTLDPSSLLTKDGTPADKNYIDSLAKKKGVSRSTIVNEMVRINANPNVNPGFSENWGSFARPVKRGTYVFGSEFK